MATTEIQNKIEQILDKVAIALIQSNYYGSSEQVQLNQKTVRNGIVSLGRQNGERLLVYQKDVKANPKDLISQIPENAETTTLEIIATNILDLDFLIIIDNTDNSITLITTPADSIYGGNNGGLNITNL